MNGLFSELNGIRLYIKLQTAQLSDLGKWGGMMNLENHKNIFALFFNFEKKALPKMERIGGEVVERG